MSIKKATTPVPKDIGPAPKRYDILSDALVPMPAAQEWMNGVERQFGQVRGNYEAWARAEKP